QFPFKDLTELVIRAHRGLKRDVAPLVEALPEGGFFLSLARSLGLPDELTVPPAEAAVSSHMLQHPDGSVYVALFTRPEFARQAQQEQNWETEGSKPEICPLPARNALYYAWKLLTGNEQVVGLFINAYQEQSLLLNRVELQNFFNGLVTPLEAYAMQTPFEEEDSIMVRPADITSIDQFQETVKQFMDSNPDISGYEVVALFDEQRNMQPYLAINFKTERSEDKYREAAESFVKLVNENVQMPERLEIMFNESFPSLI
ncbi:MAG: hypothetical protein ACAI44_36185, partial [Candidatus Sericytochromatia bacterium]